MLIKPGKVSKDYIEGKRQRFSNPFRFYLTVSVIFFLVLGIGKSLEKFKSYSETQLSKKKTDSIQKAKILTTDATKKLKGKLTPEKIDSIKQKLDEDLKGSFIPESARKEIIKNVDLKTIDSLQNNGNKEMNISFEGFTRLDKFMALQKKYPDIVADEAIDSLKLKKTFWNRFWFDRAKVANEFRTKKESQQGFISQALSYGSIALFIFLPIFTLFLKLYYIRGRKTYVDHLIFVFHTQTVFFMLLTIFFIIELFGVKPQAGIFILLFLIYLFIAMKRFYGQGYLKTFVKFGLVNFTYVTISSIGVLLVFLISFALY